jgi:hypothetical protein
LVPSLRVWVAVAAVPLGLLAGCTSGSADRALECPAAPFQHRVASGDLERDPLRGPALGDVSHGVFVHRLALDGGALVVRPPRAHDRAGSPGGEALCEVMASRTTNNVTIGRQSPDTVAAGLARVTVDPSLPSLLRQRYGVAPAGSPAARYHDRLAWVVVVSPAVRSNGSLTCTPLTPRERAARHNYLVFVVDAQTGGDALLYTEGGYGFPCANLRASVPYVDVPMTSASVPWRLVAFAPDRTFARIAVDVTRCDDGPPYVLTDHGSDPARVRVVVSRPFGAPCGPAKTVVVTARPEAANGTFPATLAHAQVGPYVDG